MTARRTGVAPWRRGRPSGRDALLAGVVVAALAVGACGAGDDEDPGATAADRPASTAPATTPPTAGDAPLPSRPGVTARPGPIERLAVGRGPRGATIFRRRGTPPGGPVVLFLHGWTAATPRAYTPWLRHLAGRGWTVIYPTYQKPPYLDTRTPLPNVLTGTRAALRRLGGRPGPLVAAGHSAGGALAADYAATAGDAGLPPARAVYAVYAGRGINGVPGRLPERDMERIPARTRIVALGSPRDRTVGERWSREIVRDATRVPRARRTYVRITGPRLGDHLAPLDTSAAARRTFWAPLDRLVRAAARRP